MERKKGRERDKERGRERERERERGSCDNITMLTTTIPCTRRLLAKLNDSLLWARIK